MAPFSPSYLQLLPPCQALPGDLPHSKSASIYGSARDHQQRWGHPSPPALWEIALEIELCQEQPGVKWSVCWAPVLDLRWALPSLLLMIARDGGKSVHPTLWTGAMLFCGWNVQSASSPPPKQMDPCLHCPTGKISLSRWTQLSLE